MQGTIVCGVTDTNDGRQALAAAVELTERLGLRLVLAHVAMSFGMLAPSVLGWADPGHAMH